MKAARTRALNAKHAGTRKHAGTGKHTPSASKKGATAHKQVARRSAAAVKAAHLRAFTVGLPCCSHEAVAASARLAGYRVTDQDVLALFALTDGASSILGALEAASTFGLAGVRPKIISTMARGTSVPPAGGFSYSSSILRSPLRMDLLCPTDTSVILGLDLPEAPHAVTLDPSGLVWSWGGLYEMTPEAVVEEAWAVMWP